MRNNYLIYFLTAVSIFFIKTYFKKNSNPSAFDEHIFLNKYNHDIFIYIIWSVEERFIELLNVKVI